jgi:hypothetical protein
MTLKKWTRQAPHDAGEYFGYVWNLIGDDMEAAAVPEVVLEAKATS